MVVILVWAKYFGPKPQVVPPGTNRPTQSAPAPAGGTSSAPAAGQTPAPATATNPRGHATAVAATPAVKVEPRGESQERTIVVENDLYRVEFSNRGAVVKSWKLKKYLDDAKPRQVLDLVHPEAATQTEGWPLALALDDPEMEKAANG